MSPARPLSLHVHKPIKPIIEKVQRRLKDGSNIVQWNTSVYIICDICGLICRVEFRVNYNQSVNTAALGESKPGKYTLVNSDSLYRRTKSLIDLPRNYLYCIKKYLWGENFYWFFKDQPLDCGKELVLYTLLYIVLCCCIYMPYKCNLGPGSSHVSTTFTFDSFVSI